LAFIEDRIMEARQIVDSASFGPEARKVIGQALNARIKLSGAGLSVGSDDSRQAAVLKQQFCAV
jgi:hypothetical protein